MSNRLRVSIGFDMPQEWLDIQHPVGRAIQNLYTELAKARWSLDDFEEWLHWNEEYDVIEEEF